MSRDIAALVPAFKDKVVALQNNLKPSGLEYRIYFTLRDPWDQAKLWRQSRTVEQITTKINALRANGGEYLAKILAEVGPQNGPWRTNALPGYSWHQWGEACDGLMVRDGKAIQDGGAPEYVVLEKEANKLGLSTLRRINDAGHVQFRNVEIPSLYSIQQINDAMLTRFPHRPV